MLCQPKADSLSAVVHMDMAEKRIPVVLLNWNNAKDTIECLESLISSTDPQLLGLVICDNGSSDDSVERIRAWAVLRRIALREFFYERDGDENRFMLSTDNVSPDKGAGAVLQAVLIHNGGNLGFAAGNNAGILYALRQIEFDYLLVLNNDTVVTHGAVEAMASRMENEPRVDMCGCKVIYYHTPDCVQAWGGARFLPLIGRARHLGACAPSGLDPDPIMVERRLDYILGVAMMVSRRLLEEVGLLADCYFLYFEEIDWALRARNKGYRLGYAGDAVIYHKEGGTIGSCRDRARRSLLSEHYLLKSRLRFTRKFFKWYLPSVWLYSIALALRVFLHGDLLRFKVMVRAMSGHDYNEPA